MNNLSHRTAIPRKSLSTPMRYLDAQSLLIGRTLDYGCGHGDDARTLDIESYDPHYQPELPDGRFQTITCNYVLNTIDEPAERDGVLESIRALLEPGGTAYISVRADKTQLNGWTKRGTWQGLIELELPVQRSTSNFCMYKLTN